jgi:DNA-binding Xre family transcriptional regulator
MKKNSQIHLFVEACILDNLKKEAELHSISISEMCRKKLKSNPKIDKIEFMLESICKRLNIQLNNK